MFTFPIPAVRNVIDRGKIDAGNNGGFRNPYYGVKPGQGEKPGLWLVGDQGVYIMSNGKPSRRRASARRLFRRVPSHLRVELTETEVSLSLIAH